MLALNIIFLLLLSTVVIALVQPVKSIEEKKNTTQTLALSKELLEVSNLPIIVIDTNGQLIHYTKKGESSGERVKATVSVYLPEAFQKGDLTSQIETAAEVGVRGNTSRLLPKKQYSLTLLNQKEEEKKISLLNMPKSSKWILNASFEDQSMLRNKLAYDVAGQIMEYAPKSQFCEVYLVDDAQSIATKHYMGIYLLVETIDRDESRLDLTATINGFEETSFIVQRNRIKPSDELLNNYGFETYLYDYSMIVEYPKADLTLKKKNYINQTISEFERILYSDQFNDLEEGYAAYIDVDSFVDYFILNEFFKNTDAGIFSTFLYKDYGRKIKAGPVWDFDSAMGNSTHLFPYYDEAGFYMPQTAWFEQLVKDRRFVESVIHRYRLLRATYLSEEYLLKQINTYVQTLGDAIERNATKWPAELINQSEMLKKYYPLIKPYERDVEALLTFFEEHPEYTADVENRADSYEEEISKLKQFIVERGQWMDQHIESLLKWAE